MSKPINKLVREKLKERGPVTAKEFAQQSESYVLASMHGLSNFTDAQIKDMLKDQYDTSK